MILSPYIFPQFAHQAKIGIDSIELITGLGSFTNYLAVVVKEFVPWLNITLILKRDLHSDICKFNCKRKGFKTELCNTSTTLLPTEPTADESEAKVLVPSITGSKTK